MIVVDTNVICYRWMASPHSNDVDKVWRKDPNWIAPLLWRSEFRNALAGALRKRLISLESAIDIAEKAEAQFAGHEFLVSSKVVMRLVEQSRCSAYDCEFVALAIEHQIPLVTLDRDLLRDFAEVSVNLGKFIRV